MDAKLYAIQAKLKELGHDPGPIDGIWGDLTRDAIAAHLGIKRPPIVGSDGAAAPWYDLAREQLGVKEVAGAGSSKTVLSYFEDAQHAAIKDDGVAWCAAFAGAMLARAGYKPSGSLMARSYLTWGAKIDKPRKGCVVVLKRGAAPSGHVGFADSWNGSSIKILGGNQGNAVTIASFPRSSVLGYRWPSNTLAA